MDLIDDIVNNIHTFQFNTVLLVKIQHLKFINPTYYRHDKDLDIDDFNMITRGLDREYLLMAALIVVVDEDKKKYCICKGRYEKPGVYNYKEQEEIINLINKNIYN